MLFVYEQWKLPTKTILSTWAMWSVAISLTLAPWLFNPQSLQVPRCAWANIEPPPRLGTRAPSPCVPSPSACPP